MSSPDVSPDGENRRRRPQSQGKPPCGAWYVSCSPAVIARPITITVRFQPAGGQPHFYEVIPMCMRAWRSASAILLAAVMIVASAGALNAQSTFAPYYGKNQIHYDTFDWHIYKTDHFEIYYYPAIEQHLQDVASDAESAYQHVSSDL